MRAELLRLAADLAERGEPFALALVVRREPASSTQPGDMAVITEAGVFHGWLGGTCTQPTVVAEAQAALADGRPRLLALSPDPGKVSRPGMAVHTMTCHSGGTVEIYLEPVLPPPRLVVFGQAPVARALAKLGKALRYAVDVVDPEADRAAFPDVDRVLPAVPTSSGDPLTLRPVIPSVARPPGRAESRDAQGERRGLFVVVATMGRRDEDALGDAIALAPAYLGVVASRRRFAEMAETLVGRGVPAAALERIRNPAGLDLGAKSPDEIALSILAEIVKERRTAVAPGDPLPADPGKAIDPICGMTVVIATARHVAEHAGRTWYFCNPRCREKFLAAPERWAAEGAGASP
jgi:xanthine dehydrogenase accessory factor